MSILKRHKNESIIIVGCGRFGSTLATMLSEQNKSIAIIDIDKSAFAKLSPSFGGFSIEGDGTDIDSLEFAGAKNTDILIATTHDDNTNIMVAQIAKEVFHIKRVITRIYDASKKTAFNDMDIECICTADLSVNEFERILSNKESMEL